MKLADADRSTLLAIIAAQAQELAVLRAQVTALTAQVAELTARLGPTSTTSSRPPSSDPPGSRPPKPPPGARRPDGPPGHPGRFRMLRPPEAVAVVVPCLPARCRGCGAARAVAAGARDPADERRPVVEVPRVVARVPEYRLAARRCGGCGVGTRARVPDAVGPEGFGPQRTAVVALLTGRYRRSKREAAQCLTDLFGVAVCGGSVSALEQAMSAALEPVVGEARAAVPRAAVPRAAVANLDATGWRQGRPRAWVWPVVTATLTVFHIAPSRGGKVAQALLGAAWAGIVGSERGTRYNWRPAEHRPVCWAHRKRDFQKLVDGGPGARPTGGRLRAIAAQVVAAWHRFRRAEIDRPALLHRLVPLQAEMAQVLEEAITGPDAKAAGGCWELPKLWPALWTFAVVAGVEPPNNAAARALPPAVLWRTGSFGTHSADGRRFVERMLTVTTTCRQQGRPVLDVLTAAITAARCRATPPSLIPAAG